MLGTPCRARSDALRAVPLPLSSSRRRAGLRPSGPSLLPSRLPLRALPPLVCCLWLAFVQATVAGGANPILNAADAATLAATLPGVGPVKAKAIVAHRERHGPFPDIDALLAVRGIGPVTLERIRVRLQEAAASSAGASTGAAPAANVSVSGVGRSATAERERAARAAVQALVARALADADERRDR